MHDGFIEEIVEEPKEPIPFLDLQQAREIEEKKISRVTVRFSLARERSFEECQSFPHGQFLGYEIPIGHDEPAFTIERTLKEGVSYEVDTYHIKDPQIIVFLNKTKWKKAVLPTEAEKEEIRKQSIAVGFDGIYFPLVVHPGRSQSLLLQKGTKVFMKAEYGSPSIVIFSS